MKGHPPKTFDGQRKNALKFFREFGLWRIHNAKNGTMMDPYRRAALALSYIKGPRVDDWVAQQAQEAVEKVHGFPNANHPVACMRITTNRFGTSG